MLTLNLAGARQVLCLGAHADDVEIGCGGTLLTLARHSPGVSVCWVVFGAVGARAVEARASAECYLQWAESRQVTIQQFRDGFFPYVGGEIKEVFEQLKGEVSPDLVFTHYGQDLHQDHRVISELTWNTFRDHLILEYEIPKYDGGLGSPNVFVPLRPDVAEQKLRNLQECFPSQCVKPWFDEDTFRALMRLRGAECNSPSKLAEAFYARKICVSAEGNRCGS